MSARMLPERPPVGRRGLHRPGAGSWALLAILMVAAMPAQGGEAVTGVVEVHLDTGAEVVGSLVREDAQSLTLRCSQRSHSGLATADIVYQREHISSVTDLTQEYLRRAGAAEPQAEQQLALARWCLDHRLEEGAARHALRAVAADPSSGRARDLLQELGYLLIHGDWVVEAAYLADHGLAKWKDRIVTLPNKERLTRALENEEAAVRERQAQQAVVDRLAGLLAIDTSSLAANQQRQAVVAAGLHADAHELAQGDTQMALLAKKVAAAAQAVKKQGAGRGRHRHFASQASLDAEKKDRADFEEAQAQRDQVAERQHADQREQAERLVHAKVLTQELDAYRVRLVEEGSHLAALESAAKTAHEQLSALEAGLSPCVLP
jgi:hypothetical protein